MKEIKIKPIGYVKNNVTENRFGGFGKEISTIKLEKGYGGALKGIKDYSHLIIVYWMDKVKEQVIMHRPQGNPEVPVVGIFACRCPQRPNPIGITTVKLLEQKADQIIVQGLDILDGTPIIDIKPYWPQYDKAGRLKYPKWVDKLDL